MPRFIVMDTESDGLAYTCTKLWNFCATEDGSTFTYLTDYQDIREFVSQEDIRLVGHNSVRHDLVAMNRILGLDLQFTKFVDTLALSWYFCPDRKSHGLEAWGETFGIHKVAVDESEWTNPDPELMYDRVVGDVKINWQLWKMFERRLNEIYGEPA